MSKRSRRPGSGSGSGLRGAAYALLAASVSIGGALSFAVAAPPAAAANWAPVHAGDFPDPSILFAPKANEYYAFATQSFASASQTINVQESTSTNGVNWTQTNVDALPNLGSWAKPGNTWAPSVALQVSGTYVMYYTATEASAPNDQCIGIATSPTPGGPYTPATPTNLAPEPIVCQNGHDASPAIDNGNYGGSIDPNIFTDTSDGSSWLIWKSDGNHIGMSTTIWSVPLSASLYPTTSSPTALLTNDQASWEGSVIEGPDMYEPSPGVYDLFFSGSDEGSSRYAIGWASCASPSPPRPCVDETTGGPLLSSAPGMSGPGGPDVYTLPGGQTALAFAAWQGNTIGYLSCGIRPMYMANVAFSGAQPFLSDPNPGVTPAASPSCPQPPPGYWQVASDGGVFTFGAAHFYGSTGAIRLNKPVVGMEPTPDGHGYWLVARDGGVFSFGDAQFYGSTGAIVLNKPIIGMISTIDAHGYWLFASDGGVFAFGDARFYGSTGGDAPPYPITAAAPGYLGGGYWMVDANGQVFNFGNAPFEGQPFAAPDGYTISGMAPTHDDQGYWLSSWNGNVADFGDAASLGSMYGRPLNAAVVGITATHDGGGYWLQGSDGGIFSFGDAPFLGSMGGVRLNAPMVGIAAL
jgi:hypothetical protein